MENQEIESMTPKEAEAQIEELTANPAYVDGRNPKHKAVVDQVNQLMRIKHPERERSAQEIQERQTARKEIDRVVRNPRHPWHHRDHPDHERAVKEMNRLHEQVNPSHEEGESEEHESEAEIEAEHQALIDEAQTEMDMLIDLGCEPADIPDDIEGWQVRGLKEQRLCMEEDRGALMPLLGEDVEQLANSPETSQLFEKYLMPAAGGIDAIRWWLEAADLRKEAGQKITMAIVEAIWDIQRERKRT